MACLAASDLKKIFRSILTYSAIAAEGYYQILGMDSSETGQFCRSHGITLEELKEFSAWINANDDIMPASQFRSREKELTQTVAELGADNQ